MGSPRPRWPGATISMPWLMVRRNNYVASRYHETVITEFGSQTGVTPAPPQGSRTPPIGLQTARYCARAVAQRSNMSDFTYSSHQMFPQSCTWALHLGRHATSQTKTGRGPRLRSIPLSGRWGWRRRRTSCSWRFRRGGNANGRTAGHRIHLNQQRLDLVQLAFDRLQSLGHADHLRAARHVHADEIFFHEIAELFLRACRGTAGLVHGLAEFRRCHRAIGEGIESLLHLPDHLLPECDRIAALLGHGPPPPALGSKPLLFRHTIPLRHDGQHRRADGLLRCRKPCHRAAVENGRRKGTST